MCHLICDPSPTACADSVWEGGPSWVRLGERVGLAHDRVGMDEIALRMSSEVWESRPTKNEANHAHPPPLRPLAHSPSRSSPPLLHLAFDQFIRQAAEILHDQIFAYLVDIDFDAQLLFQV
jgi:hypothetical protein